MPRTNHNWTQEEEERLLLTIEECQPLLEHYLRQGYPKVRWWDTVAGRLAPNPLVTGAACSRRYLLMQEQKRVHKADNEQWTKVAEMVANYEQELQEEVYDRLIALDAKVNSLCKAWDVDIREEEKNG